MKHNVKWITTTLAVTGGLIIANSAQAQYVTGTPTLSNITIDAGVLASPVVDANGLTVTAPAGTGYTWGNSDIALANQQVFNPLDNTVIWTYTINSPTPGTTGVDYGANPAWTWSGITILLAANGGSDERYPASGYDGYNLTYSPINGQNIANTDKGYSYNPANQTVTQVASLDAVTKAGIASGTITTIQFSIDPSTLPDGYSLTFDSIQLVPEPSTLALAGLGLGVAGLLIARRRFSVS